MLFKKKKKLFPAFCVKFAPKDEMYAGTCAPFTLVCRSFINFNIHQNNKHTGMMWQIPAVTVERCGHHYFLKPLNIIGFVHRLLQNVYLKVQADIINL